jgi:hypothetical protein
VSGINVHEFKKRAAGYRDTEVFEFLEFGFPINVDPSHKFNQKVVKNHSGATEFPAVIDSYITKELEHGSLLGPFESNPLGIPLALSPINTVIKSDGVSRRVIVDLTHPGDTGVNAGIDKGTFLGDPFKLELPSIDRIVEGINRYGNGCLLFKRDLKRAYRQFPVDPRDYNKLAFTWRGLIYIDKRLAMGLRSASVCCQRSTLAVGYIFDRECDGVMVVYLDDFIGIVPPGLSAALKEFVALGDLLASLGLEESQDKAVSPSSCCIILGIQFDTVKMTMEITPDRLVEITNLTKYWLGQTHITKRQLQQLLGKLQFVCKCVRQGRVFLARLLSFLRTFGHKGSEVKTVPGDAVKDINWFYCFMSVYNGVSVMPATEWESPDVSIATDACLLGCGGVCDKGFFHAGFPEFIAKLELHISELELLAIIVAVKIWSDFCLGRRITVLCDNEASVYAINKGRVRDSFMEAALRELAYVTAVAQCEVRARHIAGVTNRLPDYLSRWDLDKKFPKLFYSETAGKGMVECTAGDYLFKFSNNW